MRCARSPPTAGASARPAAGPTSILTEFRRADLADAAKVDTIVHRSAEELVRAQPASANLAPAQQKEIADWIANDPLMRGKILNYLERTLQ